VRHQSRKWPEYFSLSVTFTLSLLFRDEYDEIEQIYDYVRGFAPLPRSAKGWKYEGIKMAPSPTEEKKEPSPPPTPPEPPPLETLPSRQAMRSVSSMDLAATPPPTSPGTQADHWAEYFSSTMERKEAKKRQRAADADGGGGKGGTFLGRFVRGPHQGGRYHHRFFRHKLAASPLSPMQSLTLSRANLSQPRPQQPAPFFQLRYKSLSNLHNGGAGNDLYDTMESSNSGEFEPEMNG